MAFMEWKDSYSVGVKEIDKQHKTLVDMINTLHQALLDKKGLETQKPIIDGMVQYAVDHFATEEKYMVRFKYANYATHKEEHVKFIQKAVDLKKVSDSKGFIVTISIINFLKDWLNNHILVTDQQYAKCFQDNGLK